MIYSSIGIYGGGSWGSALACQMARKYEKVVLLLRDQYIAEEILKYGTNKKYLNDIVLPNNVVPSTDIMSVINQPILIIAVPSSAFNTVIDKLRRYKLNSDTILVIATKGLSSIKNDTCIQLLTDRAMSVFTNPVVVLSGPNFANEVAMNCRTYVTLASNDIELARKMAVDFSSKNFIVTAVDDMKSVQIAGFMKNIIAIQNGICVAFQVSENTKAALIVDGINEILMLSEFFNGYKCSSSIITTPAFIGDLVLTCYSQNSRNFRFGHEFGLQYIAHNNCAKSYMNRNYTVEGLDSARLLLILFKQRNIDIKLPIVESVANYFNEF